MLLHVRFLLLSASDLPKSSVSRDAGKQDLSAILDRLSPNNMQLAISHWPNIGSPSMGN